MSAVPVGSLMSQIGQMLAGQDYEIQRLETDRANRLRELTAQGVSRRKQLQEGFGARGLIHSSMANDAQTELQGDVDNYRATLNQRYDDRLASLARERIRQEGQFRIDSILPR